MRELFKHEIAESVATEGRATTIVTVLDLNCYDDENTLLLTDLIHQLQEVLESIPPEFRSVAAMCVNAHGEYASASVDIKYWRPETDVEYADRKRWLDSLDQEKEARDRAEFERLQNKYKSPDK